jgi:cholesterol transport system auxiliary component
MRTRGRGLRAAAALAALLAVSGCAGFQQITAVTTPAELYTLTPKSTFDPATPEVAAQLVVEEPTAASGLNTDRIAVMPNPLRMQYFPVARWVDRAPLMVQTLLLESFENSGGIGAVGRSAVGLRADYSLVTDLREFQARVPPGARPDDPVEVVVRLNVKIVDSRSDRIVGSRSFENERRAESNAMFDVALAFDAALGSVMRDAVEWTLVRVAEREAEMGSRRGSFGY